MSSKRDFFSFSVRRPVGLFVAFITLMVIGVISYSRIPLQLLPEGFTDDSVQIWVPNPGASARENEEKVARVVEEELNTLQGVKRLRSSSSDDVVQMSITFQSTVDMDLAKAEVRDRLERARPKLPATTEQIGMWSESGGSLPLSFFSVTHLGDSDETDYLIDEVAVPRLEAADGVSKIQIWGVLQDTVRIELDEDRVASSNLDVMGLIQGLSSDNFAQPLGEVVDGGERLILRSDMRFKTPDEIAEYPIGRGMKVKDVGRVIRSKSVRDQVTRVDGKYAYFGIAQKESSANVVEASRNFQAAIDELRNDPAVAGKLDFVPFFLQGDMIEASLNQLMTTALQGGFFAALVLLMFLKRVRTTLSVALAIPFSALLSLAFEYATGGSFNLLTMIGITLAIGMLVDNAVVVVENIMRVRPECDSDLEAAALGTREIALPVTLATLTTVVVFLPIIFMSGNPMARIMLGGMGLPLCAALIASLLVAVVFLPVITARVIKPRPALIERFAAATGKVMELPARLFAAMIGAMRAVFHVGLRGAFIVERSTLKILTPLRWPLSLGLVGVAVWLGVGQVEVSREMLLATGSLKTLNEPEVWALALLPRLIPALTGALLLIFGTPAWRRRYAERSEPARPARLVPVGHSMIDWLVTSNRALVDWTLRHRGMALVLSGAAFLSIMIPIKQLGESAFSQGEGGNSIDFGVSFDADFTLAQASLELKPYEDFLDAHKEDWGFAHWRDSFDDRGGQLALFYDDSLPPKERARVLAAMREGLPRPSGHRVRFYGTENVSETSNTIAQFTLRGTDSSELAALGVQAQELLESIPGLAGVTLPDAQAPDEIRVAVKRDEALALGFDSMNAVSSIVWALRGQSLPRFQERGREIPLILEYDQADTPGLSTLRDLPVYSVTGQVPLSSIADFSVTKGSNSIRRVDGQISYTLTAEIEDPSRNLEITMAGYHALDELELPRGFSVASDLSAESRANDELGELKRAFMLSIVLVFLVMGVLFESVLLPISVLTTIPFAMMGAMWCLLVMGNPLDPMGMIGLIILAGVVVNNGIVLIDRIHNLSREMPRDEAVLAGCAQRVRPIMMTALTTVMGLLPMALATPASGSIDYRAMGSIVIGGLLASTFFTLWVVPLAYTLLDDLANATKARLAWALFPKTEPQSEPPA